MLITLIFNKFEKENHMSSGTSTVYIKKLVKIVYEKEKQLESMKKALKERGENRIEHSSGKEIHSSLRKEMEYASTQMKEVNVHVLAMEKKVFDLEKELQKEIMKNQGLVEENRTLERKNLEAKTFRNEQFQNLGDFEALVKQLVEKKDILQAELANENRRKHEQISHSKQQEDKLNLTIMKLETGVKESKIDLLRKTSLIKTKSDTVTSKNEQIELMNTKLTQKQDEIDRLTADLEELSENHIALSNDFGLFKLEVETLQDNLNMKESQSTLMSQTLKDYEEFAFEIYQHIESAYARHCCQGKLKSSKKIIREVENCKTRFEAAFCKLSQIQHWMDFTSEKLQKIVEEYQLPDITLEDMSNIVHSFEQKLQLCDLTERLDRQKVELDKNEEILLDNLQREIEKGEEQDRSKLVELDEIKQVYKVIKDINRQLLNQLNGKEYIISECRKHYAHLLSNKTNPELRNLKTLLNIAN